MPGDEAAAGLGVAAAGHALNNLAVDDEGSPRIAPALGPIGRRVVPHDLAGLGIEGNQMGVRCGGDHGIFIDRQIARREIGRVGNQLFRQLALVFPDEIAGRGVEGLDLVGVIEDIKHAVMDDRGRLGGARDQRPRPRHLEILDIVLVDLVERAVAVAVKRAPPHQPVGRRRIAQHRVRNRREIAGGIGALLSERRDAGEQQRRQRES